MITDDELLTAVRESFAAARLSTPLDATVRRGRKLRTRRRMGGAAAAVAVAAGLTAAGFTTAGLVSGGAGRRRGPPRHHGPRGQHRPPGPAKRRRPRWRRGR